MTRYYFHCVNKSHHLDKTGMDLPSLDAAREEAVRWMGELLSELRGDFWSVGKLAVLVTDADWKLLFTMTTMAAEVPGAAELIERKRRRSDAAEPAN